MIRGLPWPVRALGSAASLLVLAASAIPDAAPASASASAVSVRQGRTYRTRIFPDDVFTVPDAGMITGRRVDLRQGVDYAACDNADYSICDGFRMLDQLDGFDLQPRVTIPFSGPIKVGSVNSDDVFVQGPGGRTGLVQLVWDPATDTLSGLTSALLREDSRYHIVVTPGVEDTAGRHIDACGGAACVTTFTTRTATAELDHIRRAFDDGSAYAAAGIADHKLSFVQNGTADVFRAANVAPSLVNPLNGMARLDQTTTDPHHLVANAIPNLIPPDEAGWFAFGSFESPRYQYRSAGSHQDDPNGYTDGVIPAIPTRDTEQPFGADRLGAVLILPSGTPPARGWPVAVYGPGFTRSKYDIFVSADHNAAAGIATIATDPAGHAFGPNSEVKVTAAGTTTTFLGYGRGRDLDGDGLIGDGLNDGVGPTDHKTVDKPGDPTQKVVSDLPSHKAVDGLQSGLIQTVVDNMALARAIQAGVDVPGVGNDILSHSQISYFGISFGGIYGTMLMGVDPAFHQGLLNVPGGPIVDIARLSGFRPDLHDKLAVSRPNLLNGGPGLDGFTESIPLRGDPPMTDPYPGAPALQEFFAATDWYDRSGSPESFTPLLRLRRLPGVAPKDLLFQSAYGDQTVPNPTAGTIYRAGQIFDLVTYYRNDRTPTYSSDPHGWLANPTLAGRSFGQLQLTTFLSTGKVINPNPTWFEVPVADISDLSCLHYPEPQTGRRPSPTPHGPGQGDCPHLAIDDNGGWLPAVAFPVGAQPAQPASAGGDNSGARLLPATGAHPLVPPMVAVLLVVGGLLMLPPRRRT